MADFYNPDIEPRNIDELATYTAQELEKISTSINQLIRAQSIKSYTWVADGDSLQITTETLIICENDATLTLPWVGDDGRHLTIIVKATGSPAVTLAIHATNLTDGWEWIDKTTAAKTLNKGETVTLAISPEISWAISNQ